MKPNASAPHARAARAVAPLRDDETGLERLIFFSDAVIAIAITLLALEIRLPAGERAGDGALLAALLGLWPKYLSYTVSFMVIGSYWMAHHRMYRQIVRYDRRLMLLNLLLLLCIAFIPFPTTVLGDSDGRVATIFYAGTMVATGLVHGLLWRHACAGGRLLRHPLSPAAQRATLWRYLTAPLIFALSIGLALFSSDLARLSWAFIAVALLIQGAAVE